MAGYTLALKALGLAAGSWQRLAVRHAATIRSCVALVLAVVATSGAVFGASGIVDPPRTAGVLVVVCWQVLRHRIPLVARAGRRGCNDRADTARAVGAVAVSFGDDAV